MSEIIYDMHVHILTPETCPLEFWAGKFKLTPELIELIQAIYEKFPKSALKMVEKILEDIRNDDSNFNAVAERFFCDTEDALAKLYKDIDGLCEPVKPLILNVYESEMQGQLDLLEAFSSVPGAVPQCYDRNAHVSAGGWAGIKVYPKISGKPTDELLKWANDNKKPLFIHTSKGGIWNKDLFATEEEANAACHPVSWCPYLEQYPELKIVFCHGGGNADFVEFGLWYGEYRFDSEAGEDLPREEPENNWTGACLDVMDLYPDRVWIDTAYHQSVCTKPEGYKKAFQAIAQVWPDNIVFGSDWPLVLMDVPSYKAYVEAFKTAAGPYWTQISYTNPRRVLGLEHIMNNIERLEG